MQKKFIFFLHLLFMILLFTSNKLWQPAFPKKISIHFQSKPKFNKTISTIPQTISHVKKAVKKIEETKPVAKKIVNHKSKKKPQATPQVKKPIQKNIEKSKILNQQKETIAKIEEKIDKLEQITKGEQKQVITQTSPFQLFQEEQVLSTSEVASYLFQLLELPGPGKVTVNIHLDKTGKVAFLEVLESENAENSLYLLNSLKDLVLPFKQGQYIPDILKICFSNLKA